MSSHKRKAGFTMVEVLIGVGIMTLVAGLSIGSFVSFSKHEALLADASAIASTLRTARYQTLASLDGSQYGVRIESDRFIAFKGAAYSPSDPLNLETRLSSHITASSTPEIFVFERVTGNATASGTIDVYPEAEIGNKKTVRIQRTGLVNIE